MRSELVDALGLVAVMPIGQHSDLIQFSMMWGVHCTSLSLVPEHGDDVCGVALLVPDEFESNAPGHGDADQDEAVR